MVLNKKHSSEQANFLKITGSLISRLISFFREIVVASLFGTTYVADVIQLIEGVFVSTFGAIGSALVVPFMALYSEKENKKASTALFVEQVFTIFFFLGLVFTTFLCLFPNIFLKFTALGFKGQTLTYAIYSTRIMASLVFSLLLITFFKGLFFIQRDFLLASFYEVFISIITIAFLYLNKSSKFFPLNKAFSYLGTVIILWLYFFIKERSFLRLTFFKLKATIKELWTPSKPLLLSAIFLFFSIIIDKNLASFLGTGAVSAQGYAMRIYNLPYSIWAMQIAEASFPFMVEYFQTDLVKAKLFYEENFEEILFIVLPAAVGLFLLAAPVVKIIYQRGAFTSADTLLVSRTLAAYTPYVLFFSLNLFVQNLFYARKFTKISYFVSSMELTVIILVKWFFAFKLNLGIAGLGIGAGLGELVIFLCLCLYYFKKFKEYPDKKFIFDLLKIIGATLIMGLTANFLSNHQQNLLLIIGCSVFLYGITLLLLREAILLKYCSKLKKAK